MNLLRLAIDNIEDNTFRSWLIFFCAWLMAGLAISSTLVIRGSQDTLRLILERLGADILVIPEGNQQSVEQALLIGVPASVWMPRSVLSDLETFPDIAIVSPQLFLSTMRRASCCSVSDMFMIAYDPETDFTVHPWLERTLERELQLGEAVGGCYVTIPEGRENILIYGYEIELAGNLEPTGSGLDQSMFFTFETAMEIARLSPMQAERELLIAPDSISAALIRVKPGANPHALALQIEEAVPGVIAIESGNLFRTQQNSVRQIIKSATALSVIAWAMALAVVGLMTSTAISERRQQIGVLRALGATRSQVILSLISEGGILGLAGSITGIFVAAFTIYLFQDLITRTIGVPVFYPSSVSLLMLSLGIIALALTSIILATLVPIIRISSAEPGTTIKEW